MNRYKSLIFIFHLCFLLATRIQARTNADLGIEKADTPTIDVIELNISDKTLKLCYEIKNHSEQEIWICEDISVNLHESDFEAYMAEDQQTLLIRRRLDITPVESVVAPPKGRYVRLRAGQSRAESLLLSLPVESRFFWTAPPKLYKPYATSLALEIGYYPGDMLGMIRGILEKTEKSNGTKTIVYPNHPYPTYLTSRTSPAIKDWFGSLLRFNWHNWPDGKLVRHRGEEIVIPWTGWIRIGEQVLRIRIDDLQIPYDEKYDWPDVSPPDINNCTRLEIRYQPSMLDYFFPYPNERDLLSAEEVKHLQSLQKIVADDQKYIKAFTREVGEGLPGGIFTELSTASVICYRDGEHLTSFTIYDNRSIVTEKQQCVQYKTGLPSLKTLTPQIRPFELRLRCADNLKNLWSLLRFLYNSRETYPAFTWCEAILRDRRASDVPTQRRIRCLRHPAAEEGECHYAINHNCKPNSPPEVVLLFETKAGWNQHGGPELFTFDNHDPKGGCVLLNDGTVKFIHTKEEFQQLRWK